MTINIIVKCSNDTKYTIPIELTNTVLEFKEAIATQSNTPSDKQRLIYSGRVLKDHETLETYKIQDGHTVHMVRGGGAPAAASTTTTSTAAPNATPSNPSANTSSTTSTTSTTPTTPQAQPTPQNLFTAFGGNMFDPTNPLSGFGAGAGAGANYGGFGDPNAMSQMLENPLFAQYMSAMLQNPQILDSIISSNPQFATMAPELRTYMQSPEFRAMLSDPNLLRNMLSMSSALGGGFPAYGGIGANPNAGTSPAANLYNPWAAFPQATNTSTANPNTTTSTNNPTPATNPTTATPPNPFAALLNPGQNTQATPGLPPYMDPYFMQQMQMLGAAAAANPPAAPQQPPEERFQVQLQQLQDMGFYDAVSNVRALLATGGNVEAAIEYLFSVPR